MGIYSDYDKEKRNYYANMAKSKPRAFTYDKYGLPMTNNSTPIKNISKIKPIDRQRIIKTGQQNYKSATGAANAIKKTVFKTFKPKTYKLIKLR